MSMLDPLESRSLSTGLAQRTLKNLDFIQRAHAQGEDVHVVMQTVNSLLSLLVFPVESEQRFHTPLGSVNLADPPDFVAVRQTLADFPILKSLTVVQFGNCQDLSRFFTRMRNAISHKHLGFSSDSRDLAAVIITMRDRKRDTAPFDWEITINGEDLGTLSRYVAHRVIAARL